LRPEPKIGITIGVVFRLVPGALLLFCCRELLAGVVFDGSFGTSGALPGPNFMIPAAAGKQVGGNLFQSFSQFNLVNTESATFTGPNNIQNILARVTSGSPSSIDGKVSSQIQGANLFFLNPAGVMFGPHAQLDVSGSVAVTTANYAKLVGGGRFNASLGGQDVLTSAPVSAFGFLNAAPAAVSVSGTTLAVAPEKAFSVVAGDITIDGAMISGGARINLVSVRSSGEVQLDPADVHSLVDVTSFTGFGDIALVNSTQMETSGSSASVVALRGGTLTMDNSRIAVAALNAGDGVDAEMQTSVSLVNASSIEVTALADLAGTTVATISAPSISITDGSSLTSLASGGVNAGDLSIMGDHLELTNGGRIDANNFGAGAGGSITINAGDILIQGTSVQNFPSGIGASTENIGPGGNIQITANTLTIGPGCTIQASTTGPGVGGNIRVDAGDVSITNGSFSQTGIIADTLGDGAAGSVRLTLTGQLTIAGGGQVSSDTSGTGRGGDVMITAQNIVIDGQGIAVLTPEISTETFNPVLGGSGGNIVLNIADGLELRGGGEVTASTSGSGAGGSINVTANRIFISGAGATFFAGINASTENETVGGPGGDVRLNLRSNLQIVDGGMIAVSTSGPGAGGSITITAPNISISGDGSGISAETLSGLNGGAGGNISITTDSLQGGPGGAISATTAGSGSGGSIQINARRLTLNNFTISADTTSPDTVEMPVTVSQLNVSLNIDHTQDQNLDVSLFGPDGTQVDLFNGVGGTGQNFHGTVLADDAAISIADGMAPFTGRFRPLNPLAAFDGKAFNGLWVLILSDPNLSDLGTLNSWSLTSGAVTVSSTDVPKPLPNPDGSTNNVSFLMVNLPPAAIVPITPGKGGDVRVNAGAVSLTSGALISAQSINTGGGGPGGDVSITAKNLKIVGAPGADTGISAKSFGAGSSGSVQLKLGSLALRSNGFVGSSNIGTGEAGSVSIRANGGVTVDGGSLITTSSAAENAGSINVTAGGDIVLTDHSGITASAGINGGNIKLTAPSLVYLIDSSITATAGSASPNGGTGGNISIDPEFIVLNNSLISANATIGQGGNIDLLSSFFFDSGSPVTATGTTNGTVNITAPALDLGAQLITLPASLISAENQLRERCTALLQGDFSSFISIGRGGTESQPDELEDAF
jgi:filamentous hemagglutinin family protein